MLGWPIQSRSQLNDKTEATGERKNGVIGNLPQELRATRVIEISLTALVASQQRFLGPGFDRSPLREKCGGHRRAAPVEFEERMEAVVGSGVGEVIFETLEEVWP